MNEHSQPRPKEVFAAGEGWASDNELRQRRFTRYALVAAAVAALIAVLEGVALVMLTPLKTVEPYTVLVDRQTGHTMLVDPALPRRIDADSALNQSFLARYVTAREGYDFELAPDHYSQVMSWSAAPVRDRYAATMRADNPASPIARFSRSQHRVVEILSITPVDDGNSMVRFVSRVRGDGAREGATNRWVAMIEYRYVARPMSWTEMLVNPLGFEVTAYRVSPEAGTVPTENEEGV